MIHRRPLSSADRDTLIVQAASAAHCWLVVCAGAVLTALAGLIHIACLWVGPGPETRSPPAVCRGTERKGLAKLIKADS